MFILPIYVAGGIDSKVLSIKDSKDIKEQTTGTQSLSDDYRSRTINDLKTRTINAPIELYKLRASTKMTMATVAANTVIFK